MKYSILVLIILCIASVSAAQTIIPDSVNPKQITELTTKIVYAGSLAITGKMQTINMTIPIPQEKRVSVDADSHDWSIIRDQDGNEKLLLSWSNPSGVVPYRAEVVVESTAHVLRAEQEIGSDAAYLQENSQIVFTPVMKEIAFPYEKSIAKAIELATFVHTTLTYDLSLAGKLKPSDWALQNKRGVCVEYANLLSSLLRISGIPTRYVVGYAYSTVEKKLIGHTWVEILLQDGSWMPIDPTWLEAGYLDATHIKTVVAQDANQSIVLAYRGNGKVSWARESDALQILNYKTDSLVDLETTVTDPSRKTSGLAKVTIQPVSCLLTQLTATSCVDDSKEPLLHIDSPKRVVWTCEPKTVYFSYTPKPLAAQFSYACPITISEDSESQDQATVRIIGDSETPFASISGPDIIQINEPFMLDIKTTGLKLVLFSPETGDVYEKDQEVMLKAQGTYNFILFAEGALAKKSVTVVSEKEFDLVVNAPTNGTVHENISIEVTVTNRKETTAYPAITVELGGTKETKTIGLSPQETKSITITINTDKTGMQKLSVSASAHTISAYSTSIEILQPKNGGYVQVTNEAIQSSIQQFFFLLGDLVTGILAWFQF